MITLLIPLLFVLTVSQSDTTTVYPSQNITNWIGFKTNLAGNTPGWLLTGAFNV